MFFCFWCNPLCLVRLMHPVFQLLFVLLWLSSIVFKEGQYMWFLLWCVAALGTSCMCTLYSNHHLFRLPYQMRHTVFPWLLCNSKTAVHDKKRGICLNFCFYVWCLLVWFSSFTNTDPFCYPALFTDHIAAPVKLAVAAFAARLLQNVVTSPTAQALTVVHPRAGLVADPALRARRVRAKFPLTKIRRLFEIHQFSDVKPPAMRVVVFSMIVVMVVVIMVVMVRMV